MFESLKVNIKSYTIRTQYTIYNEKKKILQFYNDFYAYHVFALRRI